MLGGFVDSLVQTFENCRAGLDDTQLRAGGGSVEAFFVRLYEQERPRLRDTILHQETHLSPARRQELLDRVDDLVRRVVIPAYIRLAAPFSLRERNDFYLVPWSAHVVERVAWAVAGMALGGFIVWAPFIPLWSKEWVLVFAVGGLVVPDLRRVLALRRYQGQLNRLVTDTDAEIWRTDLAYMTIEAEDPAREASPAASETPSPVVDRLRDEPSPDVPRAAKRTVREGER
jgi:hypothetical protein